MIEEGELCRIRQAMQELAIQVARLTQAVQPLAKMQEEHVRLRDRVATLEGFRAAILWLTGIVSAGTAVRLVFGLFTEGVKH